MGHPFADNMSKGTAWSPILSKKGTQSEQKEAKVASTGMDFCPSSRAPHAGDVVGLLQVPFCQTQLIDKLYTCAGDE